VTIAVIVLEIALIVAHFCVPAFEGARRGMMADQIVREMAQVKTAAEAERTQRGTWPAEARDGFSPEDLNTFLPPGFSFRHPDYSYKWDRWQMGSNGDADLVGSAIGGSSTEFAAVTVVTHDPRLAAMVARRIESGQIRYTLGNRTTLVVALPASVR